MDAPDPFSRELREMLGDPKAGGTTPEALIELAEAENEKRADEIARRAGFKNADDALDVYNTAESVSTKDREQIIQQLGRDADLTRFSDLVDRAAKARDLDAHEAREQAGGCLSHTEFVETSQRAADARAAGSPDIVAELKIASTDDSIIAGGGG